MDAQMSSTASLEDGMKLSSVISKRASFLVNSSLHFKILSHRLPRAGIRRRRSFEMKMSRASLVTPSASSASLLPLSSASSLGRNVYTASVTMWLPRGVMDFRLLLSREVGGLGDTARLTAADLVLARMPLWFCWLSSAAMVEPDAADETDAMRSWVAARVIWGFMMSLETMEGAEVVVTMRGTVGRGSAETSREEEPDLSCSCLLRLK